VFIFGHAVYLLRPIDREKGWFFSENTSSPYRISRKPQAPDWRISKPSQPYLPSFRIIQCIYVLKFKTNGMFLAEKRKKKRKAGSEEMKKRAAVRKEAP
jgi:hypothetical protein